MFNYGCDYNNFYYANAIYSRRYNIWFDSFGTPTIEYDFNAHEIQEMNVASYMLIQTIGKLLYMFY